MILLVAVLVGATPAWCTPAREHLAVIDVGGDASALDAQTVTALLATLPPLVSTRARDDIGREGNLSAAVDAARVAVAVGCSDVVVDANAVSVDVNALAADPRFGGLRTEDNFSEKVKDRLWKLIEELLESQGMQTFANNTRAIYLAFLASFCGVIAFRLLRRSRQSGGDTGVANTRVERARQRAFALWRKDALAVLDGGNSDGSDDAVRARRALLLLRAALLARVGEDAGAAEAVQPQRTTSEIVARLSPRVAFVAGPVLAAFDDGFYGGAIDVAGARAFVVAVDAAAAALAKGSA